MKSGIQNRIVFIFGRKGQGKSRFAKEIAKKAMREGRVVLVFDGNGEFAPGSPRASDVIPKLRRFPMRGANEREGGLEDYLAEVVRKGKTFSASIEAPAWQFDAFCRFAKRAGNCLVIVDEVDLYCSPSYASDALKDLLRRGRHYGVDQVYLTRAPSELHRDITRQADGEVYFSLSETLDLDWVAKRCGRPFADRVRNLLPHKFLAREVDQAPGEQTPKGRER